MVAVGELPEAAALAVTTLSSGSADLSREARALLVAVIGEVRYRRGEHDDARAVLRTCLAERPVARPYDVDVRVLCGGTRPRPQRADRPAHEGRRRPAPVGPVTPARAALRPPTGTRGGGGRRHPGRPPGHRAGRAGLHPYRRSPLWHALADQSRGLRDGDPDALRSAVDRLRTTTAWPALADALLDLANSPRLLSDRGVGRRARGGCPLRPHRRAGRPGDRRPAMRRTRGHPTPSVVGRRVAAHGHRRAHARRGAGGRDARRRCHQEGGGRAPLRLVPHRGHPAPVHLPQAWHSTTGCSWCEPGTGTRSTIG